MVFDPSTLPMAIWLRAKDFQNYDRANFITGNWVGADGKQWMSWSQTVGKVLDATPAGTPVVRFDGSDGVALDNAGRLTALSLRASESSSDFSTDYGYANATDGDPTTAWVAGGSATVATPQWIGVLSQQYKDLVNYVPIDVLSYQVTPRAGWTSHAPMDFTFSGMNSKSQWVVLDTRTGVTSWNEGEAKSFTLSVPAQNYSFFRLTVTASVSGVGCDIAEIGINGVPPVVHKPGEVWVVLKTADIPENSSLWNFGTAADHSHFTYNGVVYDATGTKNRQSFTPSMPVANTWRIYRVTNDGTWTAYLDGVQQAQVTGVPVTWPDTPILGMGRDYDPRPFIGDIAEFIWRDRISTAQEAADLLTYLHDTHLIQRAPITTGASLKLAGSGKWRLNATKVAAKQTYAAQLRLTGTGLMQVQLQPPVAAPVASAAQVALGLTVVSAMDLQVRVDMGVALALTGAIEMGLQLGAATEPPNGGGDILLEVTSDVDSTPSWVRVNVTNGDPDGTADITLDDDPTVLLNVDLDESGQAIGVSVPLDELEAGEHVLRTGVATATFTVTSGPVMYPTARAADRKPVPPAEVNRWALQDPTSDGVTYVFPINPARMSSPHAARVFTTEHSTAADGQPLTFEGSPVGVDWTFEGTVQTQSFYDSLEAFLTSSGRRLFCFDHLDRTWEISLESIDWEPVRDVLHPWAHRYKAKAIIYGQVQP